jgi:phage tail-like protein
MGHAERQDQYSKATGFSVEITGAGAAGSTDGSWKAVRGGSLKFTENSGVTVGTDKFAQHSLGQREWQDITLIGPLTKSRKDMLKWYLDTVEGKDHRRNLSIIIHGPDTQETHRYNYIDCFLTGYTLTPLDAESESECEETVEICVHHSDNYLK